MANHQRYFKQFYFLNAIHHNKGNGYLSLENINGRLTIKGSLKDLYQNSKYILGFAKMMPTKTNGIISSFNEWLQFYCSNETAQMDISAVLNEGRLIQTALESDILLIKYIDSQGNEIPFLYTYLYNKKDKVEFKIDFSHNYEKLYENENRKIRDDENKQMNDDGTRNLPSDLGNKVLNQKSNEKVDQIHKEIIEVDLNEQNHKEFEDAHRVSSKIYNEDIPETMNNLKEFVLETENNHTKKSEIETKTDQKKKPATDPTKNTSINRISKYKKLISEVEITYQPCNPYSVENNYYRWWLVKNIVYLGNHLIKHEIKLPLLFSPPILKAHNKYSYLLIGAYEDLNNDSCYFIIGVPGIGNEDPPFGNECQWIEIVDPPDDNRVKGFWLMYIDVDRETFLSIK